MTAAVVGAINAERRKRGLPILTSVPPMAVSAHGWARTLASEGKSRHHPPASHSVLGAPSWASDVREVIYSTSRRGGASLAVGRWLRSWTHRRAILNPKARLVGVGVVVVGSRTYVVGRLAG